MFGGWEEVVENPHFPRNRLQEIPGGLQGPGPYVKGTDQHASDRMQSPKSNLHSSAWTPTTLSCTGGQLERQPGLSRDPVSLSSFLLCMPPGVLVHSNRTQPMSRVWRCHSTITHIPIGSRALQCQVLVNTDAKPGDYAGWGAGGDRQERGHSCSHSWRPPKAEKQETGPEGWVEGQP